MNLNEKYKSLFNAYHVNTPLRIAHFMAQVQHESNFKAVRESCYYTTIDLLRKTFKIPFLNKSDEFVSQYLKNSIKCANYVYANRNGNGNEASGDGFKFRGGGMLQNTFYYGYLKLAKDLKIPFDTNPDLILVEANAVMAALNFWSTNKLNDLADLDDYKGITKKINGGYNGLVERQKALIEWKSKLT